MSEAQMICLYIWYYNDVSELSEPVLQLVWCHFLLSGFDWKKCGWGWFVHRSCGVVPSRAEPSPWWRTNPHFDEPSHASIIMTSNGNIFRVIGLLCGEFTSDRWTRKGQWRGALMFSLICNWTNSSTNNGDAGDLRRHRAHYDVTVMYNVPWWYVFDSES